MTDNLNDSLDSLWMKIKAARIALNQAWETYGETNEFVLAAGEDFDRLMNEWSYNSSKPSKRNLQGESL
jgi:uncharacterized protein with NRDE domain